MSDTSAFFDVVISETYAPDENESYKTIGNAEVSVFKEGVLVNKKTEPYTFYTIGEEDTVYIYRLFVVPEEGKLYEIQVNTPKYENTAKASIYVPERPSILEIEAELDPNSEEYVDVYKMRVRLADVPQDVVYELMVLAEDTAFGFQQMAWLYSVQPFAFEYDPYGGAVEYFGEYLAFDNDVFTNAAVELRFEASFYKFGEEPSYDKPKVYLVTYPKDYYLYRFNLIRQEFAQGDPFVEPVPVVGNFNNALGAFGARVTVEKSF